MLVKFSDAGMSYTIQCDSVSVEVLESGSRVRVSRDGQHVYDALVGVPDSKKTDGPMYYSRAYVMENGVTVDTVK